MAINYIKDIQANMTKDVNWKVLSRAGLDFSVPFEFVLDDEEHAVYCSEIVRIIPGKRLVAFGLWRNKPIVLKLFYEKSKAKQHIQRELDGVTVLSEANILTPKLLYQGVAKDKRVHALLFERIMGARSLEDVWQNKMNEKNLVSLMTRVTIELATQHVLGVTQRDLHFKNMLLCGKQIYTLDGADITSIHEPLPKKQSLDNLGLFFAQFGVGMDELQQILFQCYTQARGWIVKPADVQYLEQAIRKWNALRKVRYEKKIMRRCTAFQKSVTLFSETLYDRSYESAEFLNFLKSPDKVLSRPDAVILKAGRSSTVVKISINNKMFVVKRYNMKNSWHWLRRCLRPTRAVTSWKLAHLLRLFGVAVAKPVAMIECRFMCLRSKSYFVMEYVEGKDLGDYFAASTEITSSFAIVAQRVAAVLHSLVKLNLSHGDLKKTNILVENEYPVLLDLDGMKEHKTQYSLKRATKKEWQRFMRNWDDLPSVHRLFEKLLKI